MRASSFLIPLGLLLAASCAPERRTVEVVPALDVASCLGGRSVTELRLSGQGDFPPDPSLVATAPLGQRITLPLARGTRVLAIEGFGPSGLTAFGRSAELVLDTTPALLAVTFGPPDTVCGRASATESLHLNYSRARHHATRLASGQVVISGGIDMGGFPVRPLELYLPAGDATAPTARFRIVDGPTLLDPNAVLGHAVAPLADGGFLITGGASAMSVAFVAPAYGAITRHAPSGVETSLQFLAGGVRAYHTATVLADGRVFLAGGCAVLASGGCAAGQALATTELFDPTTFVFTPGPPLQHARWDHDAVLLGDGSLLLAGGHGEPPDVSPPLEVVDPTQPRSFTVGPAAGRAALLPTGGVLLAGGGRDVANAAVTLWLPGTTQTIAMGALPQALAGQTVTVLDDGAVLVAGGDDGSGSAPLTLLDGAGQHALGRLGARDHTATLLSDGTVLLAGGASAGVARTDAFVYLRSPLGPYSNLPTLAFDGPDAPVIARRPSGTAVASGQLVITASTTLDAAGRPVDLALVRALRLGDVSVSAQVGRRGASAAALVFAWVSDADFAYVTLDPGQKVALSRVSAARPGQAVIAADPGCVGDTLADAELPDGAAASLTLSFRLGVLDVATPTHRLLHCVPGSALGRGAVGFAALRGTAVFQGVTVSR